MTTFLEFVIGSEIGPPAHQSGGRSWWCCPFHADNTPSFCTLPHRPDMKDRWFCHGPCAGINGKPGDEADFLLLLHPEEKWPARKRRLERYRADYERDVGNAADNQISRTGGRGKEHAPPSRDYSREPFPALARWVFEEMDNPNRPTVNPRLNVALANLLNDLADEETSEAFGLQILRTAQDRCGEQGVSLEDLIRFWRKTVEAREVNRLIRDINEWERNPMPWR